MAITRGEKAGSAVSGALTGAATGAAVGSVVPVVGTAIGTGVGGILGLISNLLSSGKTVNQVQKEQNKAAQLAKGSIPVGGKQSAPVNQPLISPGLQSPGQMQNSSQLQGLPEGVGTYNRFSPDQQQALNSVLQRAMSGLGSNQFDFAPIENKARSDFNQTTVPGIAERFSSLGTGGSQRSSAFGQTLGAAGAGLDTNLAAMNQDYNLNQQSHLARLLGIGLEPQFESYYRPGDSSSNFSKNLLERLLTKENFEGAGLIGKQLKDYITRRKTGNQALDNLGEAQNSFTAPDISPTSRVGATNAIYNPGNIVPGIKTPSNVVSGVGTPNAINSMPTTNVTALKALYGI